MGRVALRLGEELLAGVDSLVAADPELDRSSVVRTLLREALAARGVVELLVPDVKRKVTAPIVPPVEPVVFAEGQEVDVAEREKLLLEQLRLGRGGTPVPKSDGGRRSGQKRPMTGIGVEPTSDGFDIA